MPANTASAVPNNAVTDKGTASDIHIQAKEILKLKARLNEILAHHTGQTVEQIEKYYGYFLERLDDAETQLIVYSIKQCQSDMPIEALKRILDREQPDYKH